MCRIRKSTPAPKRCCGSIPCTAIPPRRSDDVIPGRALARTRNLEIPRCAIAHLRFDAARCPGMTVELREHAVIHRAVRYPISRSACLKAPAPPPGSLLYCDQRNAVHEAVGQHEVTVARD